MNIEIPVIVLDEGETAPEQSAAAPSKPVDAEETPAESGTETETAAE